MPNHPPARPTLPDRREHRRRFRTAASPRDFGHRARKRGTPRRQPAFPAARLPACAGGSRLRRAGTGWTPHHLTLVAAASALVAALPLYAKAHSYGEFVFDWAWAEAYARSTASPIIRSCSARCRSRRCRARGCWRGTRTRAARCSAARCSSPARRRCRPGTCCFRDEAQADMLAAQGLMLREAVQFHWRNPGYARLRRLPRHA
ncbi:MAG: GNAT family N-acetyltransferase [Comamonadaceae bacterium]|nr:GNAT family N-acetyltransferase [Comamonadaceae bacterium]